MALVLICGWCELASSFKSGCAGCTGAFVYGYGMDALRKPPPMNRFLPIMDLNRVESDGLTYPLGDYEPEFGEYFEMMPGIHWTRTPVPGTARAYQQLDFAGPA